MDIFSLVGKLTLEGQDKVNQQLSNLERNTQKVQKGLRVAGAAFTAVGVAGLAIVQSTKKMNAQLGVTALNLGVTTKEMRDLTLATTNVTFPIDEVIASFDLLARAGVKDTEVLKATATAFDTLGDAIGIPASQVTSYLVPAMKTFGLTAEEMAKKTDIMTYMSRESTMTMADFNTMVGYTTPQLVEAGLTMDDLTAALIHMERQGYAPGRVMTREFMKATTLATKEQIPLTEALGMTSEELKAIQEEFAGTTGMTQKYADAANKQYTLMDKLKQKWSEITLSMSGFLEPLEPVLAGMTAVGPLMIGLSTSAGTAAIKWGLHTAALVAHKVATLASAIAIKAVTAAQWLWNAAMAANPIGLIIMGIAALVAAGIALWKNWDKVKAFFLKAWVSMKIAVLTSVEKILGGLSKFMGWIPWLGDKIQDAHDAISNMIDEEKVTKAALGVKKALEETGETAEEAGEKVRELADKYENYIVSVEKLIEAQEFAQTEAGKLGLTMDDLKEYMIAAGRGADLATLSYEDWLRIGEDVNEFARHFNINLEDLADTSERTTDDMVQDIRTWTNKAKTAEQDVTRAKIEGIDDRMKEERKAHQERMDALRDEYDETIKTIDAELDYALRGYENQLEAIDSQIEAIDDAERGRRDGERKAELEASIAEEKDADRRADLEDNLNELLIRSDNRQWQKERELAYEARIAEEKDADERKRLEQRLADFLLEVQARRTKKQLETDRETLRQEMDMAREEARNDRDQAQEAYDYKRDLQEQEHDDLISQLETEKETLDAALEEKLQRYDNDLTAFEALLAQEIEDTEAFVAAYNELIAQLKDKTVTITTVQETVYKTTGAPLSPAEKRAKEIQEEIREAAPMPIPTPPTSAEKRAVEIMAEIRKAAPMPVTYPGYQHGGIAMRPMLAMIGEQAPRIPEAVLPLDRTKGMFGPAISINIAEMNVRDDRDIDLIAERLVARMRLRGVRL